MPALPIANTLERRRAFQSFLGVSPALIAIILFLIVPILIVIGYSLMEANPYGGVNKVFSSDANPTLLAGSSFPSASWANTSLTDFI